MCDITNRFQHEIDRVGLGCPAEICDDGVLHRFSIPEDKGKKNCWYVLHVISNGLAYGAFGCWKRGITERWCSKRIQTISSRERNIIEQKKKELENKQLAEREKAKLKARYIWDHAQKNFSSHPYLEHKKIKLHGARLRKNLLIIPLYDENSGLSSLQFISAEGNKRFLKNGAINSCCFTIGEIKEKLYIAEGFATAATVHEVTNCGVVVAFTANNLFSVAQVFRKKYPNTEIIVCADNDAFRKEGNIGVEKAKETAKAINAKFIMPKFENTDSKPTDFNDLYFLEGSAVVQQQLASAKCIEVSCAIPDGYCLIKDGVYFEPKDEGGDALPRIFVCSRIDIVARTRDKVSESHGRLLEFKDPDGVTHRWSMPMEMLATDGAEYRRILLSMGVNIPASRKARELLTNYLQSSKPQTTALCTDVVGWHGNIFVLPDETFGPSENKVYLQTNSGFLEGFEVAGTEDDWKEHVGKFCSGNSRLVFAVSTSFAAPLLNVCGEENGGFHFRGASSSGKTTLLKVACSVWGSQKRLQRWRATANGLEGTAKLHNDCLLCLDELSEVDPKEAGEVAYMLANGSGKIRSKQDGTTRRKTSWRLLLLSAGEISLADHMSSIGKKIKAGQEVRLIDISADAGDGFGVFENLHGFENGDVFSRYLSQAASQCHGMPIREFLKQIAINPEDLKTSLSKMINDFVKEYCPTNADGQVKRGAARFAIIAAAGDLATRLGITGWQENDAVEAAKKCFESWVSCRGGHKPKEETEALQQIRSFFQLHSESRFTKWEEFKTSDPEALQRRTINRVGFVKYDNNSVEFFVDTAIFKTEICKGLDCKFVVKICKERGWLLPDSEGKSTTPIRAPDTNETRRFYHFSHLVLGDDDAQ
ncbi:MAG: hypothetical protein A2X77_04420 [Gammaproteobacteria bacterium GWE2_42_36]|nr:MAG: hypothetical protein A2X77_04420 [Gammaproteobacteria bacterium GWE2_42_36]